MQLLLCEGKLFLGSLYFVHQFLLVECLLADDLPLQVLNLCRQALLDRGVLLAHDLSPDRVELVEDLAHASLTHHAVELFLDRQDRTHGLRRDPVVVLEILCTRVFRFETGLCRIDGSGERTA